MEKSHLSLSAIDREYLENLVQKSTLSVRVYRRAAGLLALDKGQTLQQVARDLKANYNTVALWRDRYQERGLLALEDEPRSGRPARIDGEQRAKITALACSQAPQGHTRWSLRLLADRAVELEIVENISPKHVGAVLKKTTSSRT